MGRSGQLGFAKYHPGIERIEQLGVGLELASCSHQPLKSVPFPIQYGRI
jgi:hypothetical protein